MDEKTLEELFKSCRSKRRRPINKIFISKDLAEKLKKEMGEELFEAWLNDRLEI